jgi:hypothetical protein
MDAADWISNGNGEATRTFVPTAPEPLFSTKGPVKTVQTTIGPILLFTQ